MKTVASKPSHCKWFSSSLLHRGNRLTGMLRHAVSSEHLQTTRNFSFPHKSILLFEPSSKPSPQPPVWHGKEVKGGRCSQKKRGRGWRKKSRVRNRRVKVQLMLSRNVADDWKKFKEGFVLS